MRVQVICQNPEDDRVIPRMARALRDVNGWALGTEIAPGTRSSVPEADAVFYSAYFEVVRAPAPVGRPTSAYFTHREEEPRGNAKARVFDQVAGQVDLRVATCRLYALPLSRLGATVQVHAPLERDRFAIGNREQGTGNRGGKARPVVGLSGYTYANRRKGEDLLGAVLASKVGRAVDWRASGRGWPVPTRKYSWAQMPDFYRSLDLLVVPSRVEGIPMPTLEALACGVPVVIPRGVGLHDELAEVPGIWRYERGDAGSLIQVLAEAVDGLGGCDREQLRAATEGHSVEAWCEDLRVAMEGLTATKEPGVRSQESGEGETRGRGEAGTGRRARKAKAAKPAGKRGIYCVAFGEPARECARQMIASAKRFMPEVPVCLAAASPGLGEDVFVQLEDSDVGGRRAKIRAYELAPQDWETVLYLDADTEVVAPVDQLFRWAEAGWELVITTDVGQNALLANIEAKVSRAEAAATLAAVGSMQTLQLAGGVWCFRRCPATERFFAAWRREWERWAERDQAPLVRALAAEPLRTLVLSNAWNTFPKYQPGLETAGILHYPGEARRWEGKLPGRLDGAAAWARVGKGRRQRDDRPGRSR